MKKFLIYGVIGSSMEIFWTGIKSLFRGDTSLMARSSIWMILIYGMAIFLEPIQSLVKSKNIIIRGFVYMLLIYFGEYATGFFLDVLNIKVWEYTDALNVHGYITFSYFPIWFLVGLIFERTRVWLDNLSEIDS